MSTARFDVSASAVRTHRGPRPGGSLIGADVGPRGRRLRPRTRQAVPLLAIAILAALALAALRMDVIRTGYAVTEAHREELRLREELRSLTVAMRQRRDPAVLSALARERGFVRPDRLIDLGATAGAVAAPAPDLPPVAVPPGPAPDPAPSS